MRTLVIHDADRIQDYIFATGKLREIRGASALVDSLTRISRGPADSTYLDELIKNHPDCTPVFAGGGNVVLWFGEEESARSFDREYAQRFYDETRLASSTGAVYTTADAYSAAFHAAMEQLQHRKSAGAGAPFLEFGGLVRPCQSCGRQPASATQRHHGEDERLCTACTAKREFDGKGLPRVYSRFFDSHEERRQRFTLVPRDFTEIGRVSHPRGYLGVIYCDGDGIGKHIRQIGQTSKSGDEETAYMQFSNRLDDATQETIVEVMRARYPGPISRADESEGMYYPFQIIVCGGDDLLLVVPADEALDIASEFVRRFAERTGDLTSSAGVILAHDRHPFRELRRLSYEALRSAKERRKNLGDNAREGCLDCLVVKASSASSLGRERERAYSAADAKARLAPGAFTLAEYDVAVEALSVLDDCNFPSSKLAAISQSLSRGFLKSLLLYADTFNRSRREHSDAMRKIEQLYGLTDGPWRTEPDGSRTSPYVRLSEWRRFRPDRRGKTP